MDKRKKLVPKDVQRAIRSQFYADLEAGKLSLAAAAKQMRAISGMTQIGFAKQRGISLIVLKNVETGKGNPTIKTLNQIGKIFDVQVTFRRISSDQDA